MNQTLFASLFCWLLIILASGNRCPAAALELRDGDRVLLVGGGLLEGEGEDHYIETLLTRRWPRLNLTFRNLAWGGDTVILQARPRTFKDLRTQIELQKPSVILVSYGMMESFEGPRGLALFEQGLRSMLDMFEASGARIALVTPIRHEDLGRPFSDGKEHNESLTQYVALIKRLADERSLAVIDLFVGLQPEDANEKAGRLTENGVLPTSLGYWRIAQAIERGLAKAEAPDWFVDLDSSGRIKEAQGTRLQNVKSQDGDLQFTATDDLLAMPLPPIGASKNQLAEAQAKRKLRISGLPAGKHTLWINNRAIATATAEQWQSGVALATGPQFDQVERLRTTIGKKNRQFSHRYRPMNWEYLYGGRTQPGLADELKEFEPIIEKLEDEIATLRAPAAHHFVLMAEGRAPATAVPEPRVEKRLSSRPDTATPIPEPGANSNSPAVEFIDPEIEQRELKLADGFEINLYASEPVIGKPIQIAFDPQGRLWVASTTTYPQIAPGENDRDRIVILEDRNGDGRADHSTIFADDLLIPTGILPGDSGVYVHDDTKLVHLSDTDGDGRADRRRVLLTGFGTEDSHHMCHTFRWGPGGNMYFQQGIFLHTSPESANGLRRHLRAGIFEFRPRTGSLEVYLHNSGPPNPWGHYFNRWGHSFHIDSSGSSGNHLVLPTAGATSTHLDVPGGRGKLCGAEIVGGRHLPDNWQGNLLANMFMEHRVCRWVFRDDGAGYSLQEMPPLVETRNESFRPVEVKMGPDGAIYIADWYNPLIGHMQHHFRDPRRNMQHGRIWRITAKSRRLLEPPRLVGTPLPKLLDSLKAKEDYTRYQTRRVLYEKPAKEVAASLKEWVGRLDPKEEQVEHHKIEALWAYQTIDIAEPDLLKAMLRSPEPEARAAATRVLRYWLDRIDNPLELLKGQVTDENPRVRLQSLIALSYLKSPEAMEVAAMVIDYPRDRYLNEAFAATVNALRPYWGPALRSGQLTFGGVPYRLEATLTSIRAPEAVAPLLNLLKVGKIAVQNRASVVEIVAGLGQPPELAELWQQSDSFDAGLQAQVLAGLSKAARDRGVRPTGDLSRLASLLNHSDHGVQVAATRLGGAWKHEPLRESIAQLALADKISDRLREAAVEALVNLGSTKTSEVLLRLADENRPQRVRMMGIAGLVSQDINVAAAEATKYLTSSTAAEVDLGPLLAAFLGRAGGVGPLTTALTDKMVPPDVAKLALRHLVASGRDEPQLAAIFHKSVGTGGGIQQFTPDELKQFIEEVRSNGNPQRGEQQFRRKDLACISCHSIGGAGGLVGPDLGSIGAAHPIDYLVDSILTPAKAVRDGYEAVRVVTVEGKDYSGVPQRRNDRELVLRDAFSKEVVIPVADIEDRADLGSLMPTGLVQMLTRTELVDLVAFLSELGKPGPYTVSKGAIVRRWQTLVPSSSEAGQASDLPAWLDLQGELVWEPAYSLASGVLPLDALGATNGATIVRTEIEATTPGKVLVRINSSRGLQFWLDGKPLKVDEEILVDLAGGMHQLLARVDRGTRGADGLRVEIEEIAESPGRARPISGR